MAELTLKEFAELVAQAAKAQPDATVRIAESKHSTFNLDVRDVCLKRDIVEITLENGRIERHPGPWYFLMEGNA